MRRKVRTKKIVAVFMSFIFLMCQFLFHVQFVETAHAVVEINPNSANKFPFSDFDSIHYTNNFIGLSGGKTGSLWKTGSDYYYKVVDKNGDTLFKIKVNTNAYMGNRYNDFNSLSIYPKANGQTIIMWTGRNGGCDTNMNYMIQFIIVDDHGTIVQSITDVSTQTAQYNCYASATELSNGNISFVYQVTGSEYYYRIFDTSTKQFINNPMSIEGSGASDSSYQHEVAASPGGTFMVVYHTNISRYHHVALYRNDGTKITAFDMTSVQRDNNGNKAIAALSNNTYAVLFGTTAGYRLQIYSDDGTAVGNAITSDLKYVDPSLMVEDPGLIGLADGGFIVYDNAYLNVDPYPGQLYVKEFNNDGTLYNNPANEWLPTGTNHTYGKLFSGYDGGFGFYNWDDSQIYLFGMGVGVTSVSLDVPTLSLTVGGSTGSLIATVNPANATNKNVTWSSSDTSVATVTDGVVTPVGAGTATITVTTVDGNKTATSTVAVSVPVTGVTLDQPTLNLTVGGTAGTLTATVNPANATNKNVTWSSSDSGVATVTNGVVTPVGAGNATITVTTVDGNKTATSTVTVNNPVVPVTGVTMDQPTLNLAVGGVTGTLMATVNPANATNKNVTWSSSDTSVATVADGVVIPVGVGTATITVTTVDGNKIATSTVTVSDQVIAVMDVTLDQPTLNLMAGGATGTLTATVNPANATNKNVTWSSSDTSVATVADGVVTPVGVGTATITVTTVDGNKIATSTVTVSDQVIAVMDVTLDQPTLNLMVGGATGTLTATVNPASATNKNVTWNSSDTSVATVADGVVTPVGAGTATITVTTVDGNKTATSTVTVSDQVIAVMDVTLDQPTLNLMVGGATGTLTATVNPANATNKNVMWSSSDTNVATVADGVVTPVGVGTATITVTTVDGNKIATSTVMVSDQVIAVTGVTLDQPTLTLAVGGATGTLTATINPANATNKNVTWSSSDTSVATVADGFVTPVGAGTATITVTTVDGNKIATSTVMVSDQVNAVTGVTLDKPTLTLGVGGATGTLTATINPANATNKNVTWSSSDTSVATVANGVVTPRGAGTATITVTTVDGNKTATGTVTVTAQPTPIQPTPVQPPIQPKPVQPTTPTSLPAPDTTSKIVEILVNGKVENAGTVTTTKQNDQTVTIVSVDQKILEDKLAAGGQHAVVTIPVATPSDIVVGELNGQMVKSMQDKQAVLEIKANNATYTIPTQQINIVAVSGQLGKSVALQDIKVTIEIAASASETVKVIENAAAKGTFTLVAPPIDFTIKGTYGNTTIEVSKFNAYVERTIAIPEGVDPNKISTGVVVDPDGTVRHVPTKIVVIDGKYYAKINSLTNSTYSVVWHPIQFSDVANHWAKNAINNMGSRMVIEGTGNGMFSPDQDITRAEFTAILVRGLGLKLENGATAFSDVLASDWYSSAINTAYTYHLIDGFKDGTFRPNDKITREQAMVVISKAMMITDLKGKLSAEATDETLHPYTDAADASDWAQSGISDCLQANIITGRSNMKLAPKDYMTRAEVAAIVQRLLQNSDLI